MIGFKRRGYRGDGSGMCWPNTTSGVGTIEEPFGPRTFPSPPHPYPYDFHSGIDVYTEPGDNLLSSLNGAVSRWHMTHFGFQDENQLNQFTLTDPFSSLAVAWSVDALALTCARVGVATFPTELGMYQMSARCKPSVDDWNIEYELGATISFAAGALGIGLFDGDPTTAAEWTALEYDGSTFTIKAKSNGSNWTQNGTTSAQSGKLWMRVGYTHSTGTYYWAVSSDDGENFVNIATETSKTWATATYTLRPTLYWRSGDTNASAYTPSVDTLNFVDEGVSVGRFGNWMHVTNNTIKAVVAHLRTINVAQGSFVSAGQIAGVAGETGYDSGSGRIVTEHCHMELAENNIYEYSRAQSVNPLKVGYLPRANTDTNVSVVRTSANDPDGVDSHKLEITVAREDQNFDLNSISLTGNLATRSLNFDTRAGLNPTNIDTPKYDGVYIVPHSFNESSTTQVIDVFFNKTTVGSTFVSYILRDCSGTTVASG